MYVKSFYQFESNSSRTQEISENKFLEILSNNCKDFIKRPKLLQRSKKDFSGQFSLIDPKLYYRNPLKDDNFGVSTKHHTLLMDNLETWSGFPRRSQSIIGTTNVDQRTLFGRHRYFIIPFDGVKFGVAPSADLWACDAWINIDDWRKRYYTFNTRFSDMMKSFEISDRNYDEMISDLQREYDKWKTKPGVGRALWDLFDILDRKKFQYIEDGLNELLKPSSFRGSDIDSLEGFQVMNYSEIKNLDTWELYEFWTDSKCLVYYAGEIDYEEEILESWDNFLDRFLRNN